MPLSSTPAPTATLVRVHSLMLTDEKLTEDDCVHFSQTFVAQCRQRFSLLFSIFQAPDYIDLESSGTDSIMTDGKMGVN